MEKQMAYDRMDWHYGASDFPSELDSKCAGTHIGMYLAWAIQNNLTGSIHTNEAVEAIKNHKMSGTDFLINQCDEKFWEDDLNELGQEFTRLYYKSNSYFSDYEKCLGENYPSLYHIPDTRENFEKVSKMLTLKFNSWKPKKDKKWWEFWR